MAGFAQKQSQWFAEQVAVADIGRQFGTPCYIYSQAQLTDSYRHIRDAFSQSGARVHYAVKSNDTVALLQCLHKLGAGFDIVSGGELARVLAAGAAASQVVFSGVGKSEAEIRTALTAGIACFNVESEAELARIEDCARQAGTPAPVAMRLTLDIDGGTHRHLTTGMTGGKFGVSPAAGQAMAAQAAASAHLQFLGFSCHIGSQIADERTYLALTGAMAAAVATAQAAGIGVAQVDMGGGFAVADNTAAAAVGSLAQYDAVLARAFAGKRVLIEPGRSIVAAAGALLTQVEYVKESGDKKIWVVNAGMNDFLRPALYDAQLPVVAVFGDDAGGAAMTQSVGDVVGPVCESADIIARNRSLAVVAGDYLLILNTGAYGAVMASNYNARPRPGAVLVSGSSVKQVRRPETTTDLLTPEIF